MPVPYPAISCPGRTLDLRGTVFVMQDRSGGPIRLSGSRPDPLVGSPPRPQWIMISSKGPRQIERNVLLDHMVAGPGQLVGDRLEGHDALRPGLLALVIATDRRVVPNREVRCLNECPAQKRVAILRVARSLALPVSPVR